MLDIHVRNNIKILGQGEQTLLFAHGFGFDQKMWNNITGDFVDDFQVVLFDYVGSGNSDITSYSTEKYRSLEGYAQDILDIIYELKLENIVFIGHSISSMIGMIAAIKEPQHFSKIIMIGTSPRYINDENYYGGFEKEDIEELLDTMEMNFAGWASYMAPLATNEPTSSTITQAVEATLLSFHPRVALEFAQATFYCDYRKQLKELQIPTLIFQCSNDSIVPIEVGHYLNENIKNSELVVINVRGHYPHMIQPKQTAEIMKRYLSKE